MKKENVKTKITKIIYDPVKNRAKIFVPISNSNNCNFVEVRWAELDDKPESDQNCGTEIEINAGF